MQDFQLVVGISINAYFLWLCAYTLKARDVLFEIHRMPKRHSIKIFKGYPLKEWRERRDLNPRPTA